MLRLFISTVIGAIIGLGIGLFYGWEIDPVAYVDSPIADLSQRYKDDYTVMVASAYLLDADVNAAIDRLRVLDVDNVPAYVQETTERFITNSRDLEDIIRLVALAEGLGRLTPPMENFRQLRPTGSST